MPIYAYKCGSCGYAKDVLRKISEPPLTVCPACGQATFSKQVTAAGFQLKGSGWYATDFKGEGAKPAADKKAGEGGGDKDGAGKSAEKSTEKANGASDGKVDGKSDGKSDSQGATKSDAKSSSSEGASSKPATPPASDGA